MSKNIFDEAGNIPQKDEKKEPPPKVVEGEDLKKMFDRIYSYHDEVEKMLDEAYKQTGLSPSQVESLIGNPNNFPQQTYDIIVKRKEEMTKQIEEWTKLGPAEKKKKLKKSPDSDKTRKGKTLGARKKWLQM